MPLVGKTLSPAPFRTGMQTSFFFPSQAAADLGDTGSPELLMRRKRDRMSPKLGLVPKV